MKKSSLSSVLLLLLSCNSEAQGQQIDEAVFADISDLVMHEEFPNMKRNLAEEDAADGDSAASADGADKPADDDSGEVKPADEDAQGDDGELPKKPKAKPAAAKTKASTPAPAPAPKPAPKPAKKSSEDGETEDAEGEEHKSEESDGETEIDEETGEPKPKKAAAHAANTTAASTGDDQTPGESDDGDSETPKKLKKAKFIDDEQENPEDEDDEENKPQRSEEEIAEETERSNSDTRKDFENRVDNSEDFKDEYFKGYTSDKGKQFVKKLKKKGAVIELLEPRARKWISVPQSKNPMKRKNCGENENTKAHYLTSQGSKNYVQWRVKRSVADGNCSIKLSSDGGKVYKGITPVGAKSEFFQCGRRTGYESVTIKLPKDVITKEPNQEYVILQFTMYTSFGPIVQCSDMIVQKNSGFQNQKCDPHCKNGGVCKQGKCHCGDMFYGDACEYKNSASGAFSMLLFIFVIGLVIAGIGLLIARNNLEKQRQMQIQQQQRPPAQGPPM